MADLATLGIVAKMTGVNEAASGLDNLSDSAGKADRSARAFGSGVSTVNAPIASLQSSLGGLTGALGALGAAFSIKYIADLSDSWSDISSRVGIAVGDMNDASAVMSRLSDVARTTYSSLDVTAESFIRNSTALRELGYNTQQQLDYTSALNNALVISGARADRAASLQNALGRAMARGKLSGDELNNVIENGGRVAEVLAEELGVGVNQLRAFGSEGKITSQVIYTSLTKRLEELTDQAESMPATIGDAFQLIRNSILQSVGAFDQAGKISEGFANSLVTVADNMGLIVKAGLAITGLGLAKYISALTTATGSYVLSQAASLKADIASGREKASLLTMEAQMAKIIRASMIAEVQATDATIARVKAEHSKRFILNGVAESQFAAIAMEKQMAALQAQRAAQITALSSATKSATVSQLAANAAIASTSKSAVAASVAVRGLSTAMSVLGGPIGIAIIAVTGAMYALSVQAQAAEDRSNRYAEAIEKAGAASGSAAVGVEKTAEALFKLSSGLSEAQRLSDLQQANKDVAASFLDLQEKIGILGSSFWKTSRDAAGAMQVVLDQFMKGKISVEAFSGALDDVAKSKPDLADFITDLQRVGKEAAAASGKVLALSAAQQMLDGGKGGRVGKETDDERIEREIVFQRTLALRFGLYDDLSKKLKAQSDELYKTDNKALKAAQKQKDAYARIVTSAQERLAQMELEEQLVGKNGVAADVLRMKLDMLYEAKKKGLKLNSEQIKELNGLADAYGKVAERVAGLQLMEDARFERSQLFRSPIDAAIVSDLRNAGIEMDSVAGQAYASFKKTTEQISLAKDEVKSFASGFISDILNGKSAIEALGGALQKLGDKLIDMALDQAINGLFGNLAGLFGGGGGGGIGALSGQFAASGGIGLFAKGGVSDKPAIFGEAGPEAAVPLPDGRSIPVTLNSGVGSEAVGETYAPVYNFSGTSEEFKQFKQFVLERDKQFNARAVNAVNKGSKKNAIRV